MNIHVFNPEHDIALAFNRSHFTPPRAARQLRSDLGFLPALWAAEGDIVLVDDVSHIQKVASNYPYPMSAVTFLSDNDLSHHLKTHAPSSIHCFVWGWDLAVRKRLSDCGVPSALLPTTEQLARIRQLSSRETAVRLLPSLVGIDERLTGDSLVCRSMEDIQQAVSSWQHIVLKAPWSCSGRGVRYVNDSLSSSQRGWCSNILQQQSMLVAEPYYNKVVDFGMEFYAHPDGTVTYLGLSLFQTHNGAYIGNILDTEEAKMQQLSQHLPLSLIAIVRDSLSSSFSSIVRDIYTGPLGIDMMIVKSSEGTIQLHPCVEINLRRTMGHVALSLTRQVSLPSVFKPLL